MGKRGMDLHTHTNVSDGVLSPEELIAKGEVTVNGQVLSELGYQMQEGDVVEVSGKEISAMEESGL